jgi:hypothetical protein
MTASDCINDFNRQEQTQLIKDLKEEIRKGHKRWMIGNTPYPTYLPPTPPPYIQRQYHGVPNAA